MNTPVSQFLIKIIATPYISGKICANKIVCNHFAGNTFLFSPVPKGVAGGVRKVWAPSDRSPASLELPNEMTFYTGVYGELPFCIPLSPRASLATPSFWKVWLHSCLPASSSVPSPPRLSSSLFLSPSFIQLCSFLPKSFKRCFILFLKM